MLFKIGLDNDRATVGYMGISQEMMESLLSKSVVTDHPLLTVEFTQEHPRGAKAIRSSAQFKGGFTFTRKEVISSATKSARYVTAYELVLRRVLALDLNLSATAKIYLRQVVTSLYWHQPTFDAAAYSPDYESLLHAIGKSDLPYAEPTIVEAPVSPELQVALNIGENYEILMIQQKMHTFLQSLGLADFDVQKPPAEMRRKLEELFAHLPNENVGYVVGIRSGILPMSHSSSYLLVDRLRLGDITGIEPMDQAGYEFLNQL